MMHLIPQTNQEAFDMVVAHLHSLNGPSVRGDSLLNGCSYKGTKCAVGCLIDGEFEGPDNGSVKSLVAESRLNNGNVRLDLLATLQRLHDDPSSWKTGEGFVADHRLIRVGQKFGLNIPNHLTTSDADGTVSS